MKANELRIGNWITEPLSDDKNPFQIWGIYHEKGNDKINNLPITYFEPIPLTEEWLLKFGFELDYKSDYSISYGHIKNCKFSYKFNITENKSWLEYHGGAIECKYAHQLQNIYFALTGEELAIA